jgi:dynamin 1-like protein
MAELYGGARISYIFNEVFGRRLKSIDPFEGLDDEDIRTAIANANGPRPSLFVPEISFDLLVRRQISRLEQPGIQCVDLVFDEMQRMAYQSETTELSRFPELREKVFEIVNQLLRNCVVPTQRMISNLISIELAYVNTSHPDFIGGKQAVAQLNRKLNQGVEGKSSVIEVSSTTTASSVSGIAVPTTQHKNIVTSTSGGGSGSNPPAPEGMRLFGLLRQNGSDKSSSSSSSSSSNSSSSSSSKDSSLVKLPQVPDKMRSAATPTDREKVETEIIKSLISSYFDIVRKNFMDLVPKTIMHFLVNTFKEGLQNELVSNLYRETIMADLMRETEDIASRRKACREMKELLQRALEIVNEVRDFNTFK